MKVRVILLSLLVVFAISCAGQTVTEQLSQQTRDPLILSKAAYIDASDVYISAAISYGPYRSILEKSNPDLANEIFSKFNEANRILNQWREYLQIGNSTQGNINTFKELRIMILKVLAEQEVKK